MQQHCFSSALMSCTHSQAVLFSTLRRVKLIPEDAEISSLQYSRCGRTDRGVSALGQVRGN
jgi:tRNA pseudouridine38/39 synthase